MLVDQILRIGVMRSWGLVFVAALNAVLYFVFSIEVSGTALFIGALYVLGVEFAIRRMVKRSHTNAALGDHAAAVIAHHYNDKGSK